MHKRTIITMLIIANLVLMVEVGALVYLSCYVYHNSLGSRECDMSYDIRLCEPVSMEPIQLENKHYIRGGTYAVEGTQEAHLNITYNYAPHYYRVMGEKGIRSIYGMTGAESIPVLKAAMEKLADDVDSDYWESTEGNAKRALAGLLAFAQMRPDGVWEGD